ncbi:helix-turn-helix domain-containing protein [Actinomadura madurae]|uniref:Helix-turn-helix domain-containing protein n=1 Tax=Actinomadura madurae TaxID=1993 RepID=A0A1I5TB36_9ACTN|nr:helix-turn-helix transcriptional regulator [Actinomadura madurae]SFP80263.1 Helix-turn-helix domain-containing protein [Actinomadura madurae]SPT59802.1 Helix-turn-helix domain [Actinomadura madurae]
MAPQRKRGTVSPTPLAFGRRFRRLREAKGWTQDSVARRANGGQGVKPQYIGAVENGRTRCTREFAETMDHTLDANGELLYLYDDLVKDATFPTWFDWHTVEPEADMLQSYQPLLIHGLLQTPAYASALLRGDKEAVEARLNRQAILTRENPPPPNFSVLQDEVSLYRLTGSPETMKEQLEQVIQLAEAGVVTVQVVPSRGEHLGNLGAFNLATMPDRSEIAYVDMTVRGLTLTDPDDIAGVSRAILSIRSHALPAEQSLEVIRKAVMKKWT